MIIIPAIDLYEGKCVRLFKGNYAKMSSYADDPVDTARHFESIGCTHLHLVDLEGAREGRVVQAEVLKAIASATNLNIDFGGGIKTEDDVKLVFDSGASRFTAGSIAVNDPERVVRWLIEYDSDKLILGADARNKKIAIAGWNESTEHDVIEFILDYSRKGITRVICTDINVDGTLEGPSLDLYREITTQMPGLNLIASGGVRDISHIMQLKKTNVEGVIVGKAIYEGTLDLEKALELC